MTLLCAATCTIPSRHLDDCTDQSCRGCLTARAADGLLLCPHHTRLIPDLAVNAAKLYGLLASRLLPGAAQGEKTSGSKKGAPTPDDEVMHARFLIQRTLVVLAKRIADERGVSAPLRWSIRRLPAGVEGPANRVARATGHRNALAEFIGRHAEWLAAQPDAGHLCDLLLHIGRVNGPVWRLAYPHRADRLYVGDCPLPMDDDQPCGSRLYQVPDQPLITCQGCGTAETIEQWERWLYPDGDSAEVDAYAGARALSRSWFRPVDPGLIRQWQHRGKVLPVTEPDPDAPPPSEGKEPARRIKKDERGRTLYPLAGLRDAATKAWGEAPKVRGRAA
jgi:hypothetical protein